MIEWYGFYDIEVDPDGFTAKVGHLHLHVEFREDGWCDWVVCTAQPPSFDPIEDWFDMPYVLAGAVGRNLTEARAKDACRRAARQLIHAMERAL